jgi:hypothetical protein
MLKSLLIVTLFLTTLLGLSNCGLDCIDKKTGMHKSSETIKEAQEKEVYKFEFIADKQTFQLDSGLVFNIKNAWVENSWKYECIDNKAEVVKDSLYQFVIDADYKGEAIHADYWLGHSHLGSILSFGYSGKDTFTVVLYKDTSYTLTQNKLTIDTISFIKRQVTR